MNAEFPLETDDEVELDPVCGEPVDLDAAVERDLSTEFEGRSYVFCGHECRERFARAPERYAAAGRAAP